MKSIIYIALFTLVSFYTKAQIVELQPGPAEGIDASVSSLFPDRNSGDHPELAAIAWTNLGDESIIRGYIKFDLDEIPKDAILKKATLFLYWIDSEVNVGHSTMSGSNEAVLKRVTGPWEENAITWNTQPSTTSEDEVTLPASDSDDEDYEVDVTKLITFFIKDPDQNHGLLLKLKNESYYRSLIFGSSDYNDSDKRPKLVMEFECTEPVANFSYDADELKVQFINESQNAETYFWNFGDGNTSTEENPEHRYDNPGEYVVKLTAKNFCGTDEISKQIFINCEFPEANFTVEIEELTVRFKNRSEDADSYEWDFGDGNSSSSENPTHTYDEEDTYTVTLTVENSCGESIKSKVIGLSCPEPDAYFEYRLEGFTVHFQNFSERAEDFKWDFGDGNFSFEAFPTYTYSRPGIYRVELEAENDCGEDEFIREIEIEPVGISETDTPGFGMKLFPNPSKNTINIQFEQKSKAGDHLSIYSFDGKLLRTIQLKEGETLIEADISGFLSGIYLFILNTENGIAAKDKLIIK